LFLLCLCVTGLYRSFTWFEKLIFKGSFLFSFEQYSDGQLAILFRSHNTVQVPVMSSCACDAVVSQSV